MATSWVLVLGGLILFCSQCVVDGFSPSISAVGPGHSLSWARARRRHAHQLVPRLDENQPRFSPAASGCRTGLLAASAQSGDSQSTRSRRSFIVEGGIAAAATLWLPGRAPSAQAAVAVTNPAGVGYPPIPEGAKRIFLCRHGETELNRLGKIQGARMNPPLNDEGMRQAKLLAGAVALSPVSYIASSRLLRAQQTAEVIRPRFPLSGGGDLDLLNEVDFGSVDGLDLEEARKKTNETYLKWASGDKKARNPGGGESFEEVDARIRDAISVLLDQCRPGEASLAVTHSSYLRIALSICLGWSLEDSKAQKVYNCSVCAFDMLEGSTIAVPVCVNDVRHLQRAAAASAPSRRLFWVA